MIDDPTENYYKRMIPRCEDLADLYCYWYDCERYGNEWWDVIGDGITYGYCY